MTIPYHESFLKVLFRWRGSVWKAVWKELLCWIILYYTIRFILVYAIPANHHDATKNLVALFDIYLARIPLEFLLGFFVATTVGRWWSQAMLINNPMDAMGNIAAYIPGLDEESRYLRHTIARYLIIFFTVGYRTVSSKLRRIFPNNKKFIQMGLMTEEESEIIENAPLCCQNEVPLQWISEMVRKKAGNHNAVLTNFNFHRGNIAVMQKFDGLVVPLVYTQTVTVIVYGYFLFSLIGHQFYDNDPKIDFVVPVFTILRFVGYVGWLKVAEDLQNPWGDDDDDIDLCACLADFSTIAFTIADYIPDRRPFAKGLKNDESKGEYIRSQFDASITRYEHLGDTIVREMKNALSCGKKGTARQ